MKSLLHRRTYLKSDYKFYRPPHYSTFYDFDAWVYGLQWPQMPNLLPLMGKVSVVADDIKFASNAWSLLRVCAFYGLPHPRVLSDLSNTTPSMSSSLRGNWKFYEHCTVGSSLNKNAAKVALMPSHPKAIDLADMDWGKFAQNSSKDGSVEIVLGMENGMREDICASCDAWLSIPQYGSVGSLSMLNALGIVLHSAHSALHPKAAQRKTFIGASKHPNMTNKRTVNTMNGKVHPSKIVHPQLHHSSAVGLTTMDGDCDWLATEKRDFTATRPHGDELLGLDDTSIARLLAERRKKLPLQLATYHYNESGDRNIGAVIRNGNIYNFEKMIIVGRKRFSRRGSVGTHHYTDIRYHDTFEAADKELEGYAVWVLHNPYPYLCNRVDEVLPDWTLPPQLSVGKKAAKDLPGSYMHHGHPLLQEWLAADGRACLIGRNSKYDSYGGQNDELPLVFPSPIDALTHWESDHPMYGVLDHLLPTVHADDDESIMAAVQSVKDRGLRGIVLVVPEEGSTPVWPLLQRAERLLTIVHPARMCSIQRGITSAVSTAIALERLREATLMLDAPR